MRKEICLISKNKNINADATSDNNFATHEDKSLGCKHTQ